MPELRILRAHGQMDEHELEEVMLTFVRGDADVLVCHQRSSRQASTSPTPTR